MWKKSIILAIVIVLLGGCDSVEQMLFDTIMPDIDILDIVLTIINAVVYAL